MPAHTDPVLRRAARRPVLQARVTKELDHAYAKHGTGRWGRHEFYAILLEEVDELWEAVKKDLPADALEAELVQVVAVCFRYFETGDRYAPEFGGPRG